MLNIENFGQNQDQDQYQVDSFLPILGLVLRLAPKKVPNLDDENLGENQWRGLDFFW